MLDYLHLDVFTRQLFGGNQLAVFLDPPADLGAETMQAIARELAFSETTFVFPPERPDTDIRLRIFTPAEEMPMAGHPTIGTAFALAHAGRLRAPADRTVFGEGVGPVPVSLAWSPEGQLSFAWMTQPAPEFGATAGDEAGFAAALGLSAEDLGPPPLPVQRVSCGAPFVLVPVRSRAAVDRAAADARALARAFRSSGWPDLPVYVFSLEPGEDDAGVYTRMFAPTLGIGEDAATGAASGPLGAYLVQHGAVDPAHTPVVLNLQGVRMGRPSYLHISPVLDGRAITGVRVGGEAIVAGDGRLRRR